MEQKAKTDPEFSLFPVGMTQITIPFAFNFLNFQMIPEMTLPPNYENSANIQNQQITDQSLEYFKSFFSPKETAKSLQRRNQNLQMLSFENSDGEEPDDVYNRRKKKVSDLITQQNEQVQAILTIRNDSLSKYDAIIEFVKFFCRLKQSLQNIRTDYYSSKTFCAIRNASEEELVRITRVMGKMYNNVKNFPTKPRVSFQQVTPQLSETESRVVQFLIIPRFLISKQKIVRLIRDEELQRNFQFLVVHECLGHYNNEANKKMPEEKHMKLVRQLLLKPFGREKFKKICSINHGNKFLKSHGEFYYSLYSQSLSYLQHLDNSLKKGKKFQTIKKDLQKMAKESEETIGNSSFTENESSSNSIYSFKSLGQCLNKIEQEGKSSVSNEKMDEPEIMPRTVIMPKKKIKKMMSTPEEAQVNQRTFQVRKFKTMQQKIEKNIILVSPPRYSEI